MEVDRAFALIQRAASRGKMPNAYLFTGRLNGDAMRLAVKVLGLFFANHVEDRINPDIHWLFPEKKSRIISVEAVREKLVNPISQTAFADGWKAGVVVGAECFRKEGANAFLKTLEEPPPQTFFLLLCEAPDKLLPTIISRCQRIDLNDISHRALDESTANAVVSILNEAGGSWVSRLGAAGKIAAILASLKERAQADVAAEIAQSSSEAGYEVADDEENARVLSVYRAHRLDLMLTILEYFRKLMAQSAISAKSGLPLAAAFRNIDSIEKAVARMDERNMSEASVLGHLFEVLAFPKAS